MPVAKPFRSSDPVLEKVDRYLQLIAAKLDFKLVKAVDTHLHADYITGLGALRDQHALRHAVIGENTKADRGVDAARRG